MFNQSETDKLRFLLKKFLALKNIEHDDEKFESTLKNLANIIYSTGGDLSEETVNKYLQALFDRGLV